MSNPFDSTSFYAIPNRLHPDINITGENQKGLVVVFRTEKDINQAKIFLQKIVSALKLDPLQDAMFIHLPAKQSISLFSMNFSPIHHILLFGVQPSEIGINIDFIPYTNLPIQKARLMVCHSTDVMEEKTDLKRVLWEQIQIMFGLKSKDTTAK